MKTLALLALTAVLAGSSPDLLAQSACRPADALSSSYLYGLQTLATSTDSIDAASRTISHLPTTSAANVTYVTDKKTCEKAVTTLNTILGTSGAARSVYVFKFGTSFVVVDPDLPADTGGGGTKFIFNKQWVHQHVWVSP